MKKYAKYRPQKLVLKGCNKMAENENKPSTLDILKESGLIGCISAESDLSTNYKSVLNEKDIYQTPTEEIIQGIGEGLKQALTAQTIPLEKMWEDI